MFKQRKVEHGWFCSFASLARQPRWSAPSFASLAQMVAPLIICFSKTEEFTPVGKSSCQARNSGFVLWRKWWWWWKVEGWLVHCIPLSFCFLRTKLETFTPVGLEQWRLRSDTKTKTKRLWMYFTGSIIDLTYVSQKCKGRQIQKRI